jgi:2-keto-4-pentenoate hydratase
MTESTLAAQLVQARRQRTLIEDLESADIPADANAAYAIQHEVLSLTGARIGAWKVGARSPGAQANTAAIDAELVHTSPAHILCTAAARRSLQSK